MLTFRYHLVTIVAVFLALAIGIVVGSTFVGPSVVESLRNQVEDVSDTLDERKAANDRLTAENEHLDESLGEASPWAVDGRLDGRSVLVVADRGVGESVLEQTDELLQQAGATTPGTLWIDPAFALDDEDEREALAAAIEVDAGDAATLQRQAWRRTLRDLSTGAAPDGATQALIDAGFFSFSPVGEGANELTDLADDQFQVLLVSGTGSDLESTAHLAVMTDVLVERGQPAVLAEEFRPVEDGAGQGDLVALVRDDAVRAAAISTVDDLASPSGRLAAVLAEAEAGQGEVGHYGIGDGAEGPMPEWPESP
ncbi:MAG TPA: copper transporter, partial [Acidimicrobiales bacterium]|nr:copper transporter [Acidimicrobiales bacterium]